MLKILLLFSRSVVSDSVRPRGLRHARLPCPSLSPGVWLDSCPLSWRWQSYGDNHRFGTWECAVKETHTQNFMRNTVNMEKCIWWRKETDRTVSRLTPTIIKDMILTGWNIQDITHVCVHMSIHIIKLKEMTFWINQFYTTLATWSQHVLSINSENKLIHRSHYLLLPGGKSLSKVKERPQVHQEPIISCLNNCKTT